MTQFLPFALERYMSRYEQTVDYNLSESGVHPVQLRELLAEDAHAIDELLDTSLNYPHVNGTPELRQNIAHLYSGAHPDNVLVTVGAIEANYIAIRTLLAAGDEIVIMRPNYMQIWGVAQNHHLRIQTFRLNESQGWAPDLAELGAAVSSATKLIAVCNPNNPTGRSLTEAEMDAIVAAAESVGAWILADEVYAGAERQLETQTPSFYGRYDKVLAVGSLSKAYGLPGLRLGWVVAPRNVVDDLWARHEYLTLSATALSNKLATIALSAEVRPRLLHRSRQLIRSGFPVLEQWVERHAPMLQVVPPDAAAIAFVRYGMDVSSVDFADRVRERGVLLVPGAHFGEEGHFRISFGFAHAYLNAALARIDTVLEQLS